jgi:hypothetical protein
MRQISFGGISYGNFFVEQAKYPDIRENERDLGKGKFELNSSLNAQC